MRCNRTFKKMALFYLLSYTIKRVHFALGQYSGRSEKTAKCGNSCASSATYFSLTHLTVTCDLFLNRRTAS